MVRRMRQYTQSSYERLSQYIRPQLEDPSESVPGHAAVKLKDVDERIQTRPSIALTQLFQRLSDHAATSVTDVHILDLGPARQNILELAARQPYTLHIADVVNRARLSRSRSCEDKGHVLKIKDWRDLLPPCPGGGFLAVLCWDIFNYLSVQDIRSLAVYLDEICEHEARIHSISYTSESMPTQPLNFEFLTPATLYRRNAQNDTVVAPRYGANVIAESMAGFHIEHLYQHGCDAVEELYQRHSTR